MVKNAVILSNIINNNDNNINYKLYIFIFYETWNVIYYCDGNDDTFIFTTNFSVT